MDTRRFFVAGIATLAIIIVASLIAIFSTNRPDWAHGTRLATIEELEQQGVIEFSDHDVFLVHNEGGEPLVLSADAQHVGDLVVWCESSGMFESPAHGEKFDSRGFYYGGPAARGLARYPYSIIDGVIYAQLDDPTTARRAAPGHLTNRAVPSVCLGDHQHDR